GAGARQGDPRRQAAHRPELRGAHRDRGRRAHRAGGGRGRDHDRGRDVHRIVPIRQYAEDWTLDRILRSSEDAVTYAVKPGWPVMYVTEDTTRAKPDALKALYGTAIACGATRICLADTVGHATPDGVKALVKFVKEEIVKDNRVKVDWHGHRDRGLGLINCLAAIEAGVDRVHGPALGVGERG